MAHLESKVFQSVGNALLGLEPGASFYEESDRGSGLVPVHGGNLDTGGVDYGCKRARNALHAARIRRSGSEH